MVSTSCSKVIAGLWKQRLLPCPGTNPRREFLLRDAQSLPGPCLLGDLFPWHEAGMADLISRDDPRDKQGGLENHRGRGGGVLPFQERKTNPRGITSERLPARGSKVRAGGEAESPGRGRCGGAGAVLSRQVGPCRGPHFQEPSATQRRGRAGGTGGSPPRGGGPGGPGPPLPPGGTAAPRATPTEGAACEGLR